MFLIGRGLNSISNEVRDHLFSTNAKFFEKLTFLNPLIRTRSCAYQGVRKVSFSENFAYVLNGRSLIEKELLEGWFLHVRSDFEFFI